ncbi:hypothetical protein BaRGS_00034140, partial [Batillaria attramentaria]
MHTRGSLNEKDKREALPAAAGTEDCVSRRPTSTPNGSSTPLLKETATSVTSEEMTLFQIAISLSLFLPCAAATADHPDDSEHEGFLLFDIRGRVKSNEVLQAFEGVPVFYKFQLYGGTRFIVVTAHDYDTENLHKNVRIRSARKVIVHTAELWEDYCSHFNQTVSGNGHNLTDLPDDNLLFLEVSFPESDASLVDYELKTKGFCTQFQGVVGSMGPAFRLTTNFPSE